MTIDRPTEAQAIAQALRAHLPLTLGSMRVWGDWFGRPMDNQHVLVGARHDGDALILEFDHHEVLRVQSPVTWTVDASAARTPRLVIRRAQRVDWGWYCHGRPETPANWAEEHHWIEDGRVRAGGTDNCVPGTFEPSVDEPAVTFL